MILIKSDIRPMHYYSVPKAQIFLPWSESKELPYYLFFLLLFFILSSGNRKWLSKRLFLPLRFLKKNKIKELYFQLKGIKKKKKRNLQNKHPQIPYSLQLREKIKNNIKLIPSRVKWSYIKIMNYDQSCMQSCINSDLW